MKLIPSEEVQTVYFDEDENEVSRDVVLEEVRGKSLAEAKRLLHRYRKARVRLWKRRDGVPVARSYTDAVIAMEIKPGDLDQKRANLLRRLREAQQKVARPDATQQDIAEALSAQAEYLEFLALYAD